MSVSNIITTTDVLPSSISKLMSSGLNWMAFTICSQDALEAKGLWGHFDGTSIHPTVGTPPTTDEESALSQWIKNEKFAKALLTHHIPNAPLRGIYTKPSLKECWDLIKKEYLSKGAFAQADLHTHFMGSKFPEKTNVREFLNNLWVKKKELVMYGVDIEEKDYCSTIIKSLPPYLSAFASNLLAGAKLYSSSRTIELDKLIVLVSEEY